MLLVILICTQCVLSHDYMYIKFKLRMFCCRLGRKKTALIAMFLLGCAGTGCAFSPNYYVFVVLRFIIAACSTGMYMCLFVLGTYNLAHFGNFSWSHWLQQKLFQFNAFSFARDFKTILLWYYADDNYQCNCLSGYHYGGNCLQHWIKFEAVWIYLSK